MSEENVDAPSPRAESPSSKKRKSQIDEIEVDLTLPEPPSKKAKRLLKKGKPLPVKPASDDEADDGLPVPKTNKDGKDKKSQRSEYGIWIGNLPWTMTRVELFKWLVESSGGVIKEESITRVNLPMSKAAKGRSETGEENKPQNRGFAYVDFDSEAPSIAARALSETELNGRKVLIKDSKSFEGRPQKESAATENGAASGDAQTNSTAPANVNTSRKIFVGNLGFATTEEELSGHFDKCGEIEWVKVATFEDTGKCKGFGWVKFREAEAADWAVKGFVRIKEDIETEDDFKDSKDDVEADDEAAQAKKTKTRKWWVNRLKGRELKIDFAEDDQVRYKKRFGKDAPGKTPRGGREQRPSDGNATGKPAPRGRPVYGDSKVASYKTGSMVQSEGKKTTFD